MVKQMPALPFGSSEFTAAWDEFLQHRREKRQSVTPLSAKKLFSKFAEWGETRAIAAIHHSIAMGYQGVFEPKGGANNASNKWDGRFQADEHQ